jgi:UDP-N-acetylmuramoyl-tripeptide--D-alanyl-D-alanine ligase
VIEALPAHGVAVFPADDEQAGVWRGQAGTRPVLTFALSGQADVSDEAIWVDDHWVLRVLTPAGRAEFLLHAAGLHNVRNALAATAAALAAGVPLASVMQGLEAFRPVSGRSQVSRLERAGRSVTLVNDSYNANPESVRAAIEALAAMSTGRRSWAVLGEMLELGAASMAQHEEVGRLARGWGVARVVAVGEGAQEVHTGALAAGAADGEESLLVPDVDAAVALLEAQLRPGDVVLVKASRGAGLDRVAAALLADRGDAS